MQNKYIIGTIQKHGMDAYLRSEYMSDDSGNGTTFDKVIENALKEAEYGIPYTCCHSISGKDTLKVSQLKNVVVGGKYILQVDKDLPVHKRHVIEKNNSYKMIRIMKSVDPEAFSDEMIKDSYIVVTGEMLSDNFMHGFFTRKEVYRLPECLKVSFSKENDNPEYKAIPCLRKKDDDFSITAKSYEELISKCCETEYKYFMMKNSIEPHPVFFDFRENSVMMEPDDVEEQEELNNDIKKIEPER